MSDTVLVLFTGEQDLNEFDCGNEELNAWLPDGVGSEVKTLIASWTAPEAPGVVRDDFAAVNLGQLKAVAQPFYDQLMAAGFATQYPWSNSATPADNQAVANLGQLKNLFSFDVALSSDALTL